MHLRNDAGPGQPLRQAALDLAERSRVGPAALNRASREAVRTPDGTAAACRHARLQAEEACRLCPGNGRYQETLGMALYRTGQYQAVLEALARAAEVRGRQGAGPVAPSLAFRAMAESRLGRAERAWAALTQLREATTSSRWARDAEAAAFLREAAALTEGVPANSD